MGHKTEHVCQTAISRHSKPQVTWGCMCIYLKTAI